MQDMTYWKKWVQALRGGRYKQCKILLNAGDEYCAVGVLLKELGLPFSKIYSYPIVSVLRLGCDLDFLYEVAAMNNAGATFDDCADYIEQYLAKKQAQEVMANAQKNKQESGPKPVYA